MNAQPDDALTAQRPALDEEKPWSLIATGDWLAGQRFEIKGRTVLGRESSCDITIPGTHLSRRHAELVVMDDCLLVRDLGSSNGTYVNGEKITEAEVHAGDQIKFDVLSFSLDGPTPPPPAASVGGATAAQSRGDSPNLQRERKWKHKPTSVGNREKTVQMSLGEKATLSVTRVALAFVGVLAVLLVVFLISQL